MIEAPLPPTSHGRKLTRQEYERAVVQLFQEAGGIGSTPEEQRKLRRDELNLAIDYRLGIDFPQARRDSLWQLQEEIERRRIRMLVKSLAVWLLPRVMGERRAAALVRQLVAEYANVLSPEEMQALFGPLESIKDR